MGKVEVDLTLNKIEALGPHLYRPLPRNSEGSSNVVSWLNDFVKPEKEILTTSVKFSDSGFKMGSLKGRNFKFHET